MIKRWNKQVIVIDETHRKGPGSFQIHLHSWVDDGAFPKCVIKNKRADEVSMMV